MSAAALHLYQKLTEATDDRTRAQIIAEAFSELEDRYPQLKEVATQPQLRETELRLQKEIREVELQLQKEIREVEAKLQKEIREVELRLQKEIEKIRVEIKGVELKIADTRADLIRWVVGVGLLQSTLMTGVLLKIAHLI